MSDGQLSAAWIYGLYVVIQLKENLYSNGPNVKAPLKTIFDK